MIKKRYFAENADNARIDVEWRRGWTDLTLKFNGRLLGNITSKEDLMVGQEFISDTGDDVSVRLVKNLGISELEIICNYEPVPHSPADPYKKLHDAFNIVIFLGIASVALGMLAELVGWRFLINSGFGYMGTMFGLVILILSVGVRNLSAFSLVTVIVLVVMDILFTWLFVGTMNIDYKPLPSILFKMIFLVLLVRAIPAMASIRKLERESIIRKEIARQEQQKFNMVQPTKGNGAEEPFDL